MAVIVSDSKAVGTELVDEKTISVLSTERLAIMKALAKEPKYPAELAKQLGMPAQTVYYHVRLLSEAGLIKMEAYEERGGAVAKKYGLSTDAVSVIIRPAWRPVAHAKAKTPHFLAPFASGGRLDAKMVLGSPDPHGKYRARGAEYCAAELAIALGQYASFSYPLYLLDTEVREGTKRENLILVGGPKVNTLVEEVNKFLPIYFEEKTFGIRSKPSGKKYEENVGVVEVVENPFNKSRKVLVAAGLNQSSTRTAVLSILKEPEKIGAGNAFDKKTIAHVVQGFDEDGDGIVDAVEVLE
ncbi:MAG: S-layer protein [Candidatus Micrarchaeota archaeon]|nr:S-layer protein [Candidatus Micrarchaeota archaeon]